MKYQVLASEPYRLCVNSPPPWPFLEGFTINEKLNSLLSVINETF